MAVRNHALAYLATLLMFSAPALAEIRRGEGIYLNSEYHENGKRRCNFSNGTTTFVELWEECFASGPPRISKAAVPLSQSSTEAPSPHLSTNGIHKPNRGEGIYLNSERHGQRGEKYCQFSNGDWIEVRIGEDCFNERPLKSASPSHAERDPTVSSAGPSGQEGIPSFKIKMGQGVFLNSSYLASGEKMCNFSNGLTYIVDLRQDCFGQEPIRILKTQDLKETEPTQSEAPKFADNSVNRRTISSRPNASAKACAGCKTAKNKKGPARPN